MRPSERVAARVIVEIAVAFIGGALAVLYVGLSHWALVAAVRSARRSGLLLKMSE